MLGLRTGVGVGGHVTLTRVLVWLVVVSLWSLADWTVKGVRAQRRTVAEHLAAAPVGGAS